jgi:hypothetical protein
VAVAAILPGRPAPCRRTGTGACYTGPVMADHLNEGTGTFVAAVGWAAGTLVTFVLLSGATHEIVRFTVKKGSPDWRAVVAAVIAMSLLSCGAVLLAITGRGLGLLPARRRRKRADHAIQARRANQDRGPQAPR